MAKPKTDIVTAVREGYAFEGQCVELGALIVDDGPRADAKVRVPLAMLNRHGLVAGATGTGKTKTLQLMAEQLSAARPTSRATCPGWPHPESLVKRSTTGRPRSASSGNRPHTRLSCSGSAAQA